MGRGLLRGSRCGMKGRSEDKAAEAGKAQEVEAGREEERKFFADAMLGRLALWMRVLGYDVRYERSIEDAELITEALSSGRIILTRDTLLMKRRAARGNSLFIRADLFHDQLKQVVEKYPIGKEKFLTRCLRCNLALKPLKRAEARARVPEYVYQTQPGFSTCPGCGRVYWGGTHRAKMVEAVSAIIK